MKHTTLRILALVMALVLALPALVLAEDEGGVLTLPESGIELEELDLPASDDDPQEDVDVTIEVPGDGELEIPVEEPVSVVEGDETLDAQAEVSGLEEPGEAAEPTSESTGDDGAPADNGWYEWYHVDLKYIDAKGEQQGPVKCYKFTSGSDNDLSNGWYAVIGNVTYSKSIYVRGNANLILCDGAKLTAKDGICVEKDAKLTIWAQSHNEKTRGKLVARGPDKKAGIGGIGNAAAGAITINGGDINTKGGREYAGITADVVTINNGKVYACGENGGAGIGGNNNKDGGKIVINGGDVYARGNEGGAGIGGGKEGNSGTITINGGKVKAESKSTVLPVGAGIGGGSGGNCNDVTITGGDVTGHGGIGCDGRAGAGIGGGQKGNLVGTVTIKGGRVVASDSDGSAGIGGGWAGNALQGHVNISGGRVIAKGVNGGAGIGGGRGDGDDNNIGGQGSHVSITGTANVIAMTITTKRYSHCSAIGHGHNNKEYGTITFGDNMMVQADWSSKAGEAGEPFPWDNRQGGCFYRWYAHIQPCDHRNATCTDITEQTHTVKTCKYCKTRDKTEPHNFNARTRKCRSCGAKYQWKPAIITFHSNGGEGMMEPQKLDLGRAGKLNANTFTCQWHTFKGWNTEPDGSGTAYADGAEVRLKGNLDLYAQWYTNVTIVALSKQVRWTGKPRTVKGYSVRLESDPKYEVKDAVFKGVSASRTETEMGAYEVKVEGAKINETTDEGGQYIVTRIENGVLLIGKAIPTLEAPKARKLT